MKNPFELPGGGYGGNEERPDEGKSEGKEEKITRRSLFGAFRRAARGESSVEPPAEPISERGEISEKKVGRRKFLERSIQVGTALALAELGRRIIPEFLKEKKFKNAFLEEAKRWQDYQGELQFVVPESSVIGDTRWSEDDQKIIQESVRVAKEIVDQVFGRAAVWTDGETTIAVNDFWDRTGGQSHTLAYFLDGDGLAEAYNLSGEEKKAAGRINLLAISPGKIEEFRRYPDILHGFAAHEIVHAYDQYPVGNFPRLWREGMAEMCRFAWEKRDTGGDWRWESNMRSREKVLKSWDVKEAAKLNFSEIEKKSGFLGEGVYKAVGTLFFKWHEEHPDFFKNLRKLENDYYTEHQQLPTKEEWLKLGEKAQPGFVAWIESHPVLNISD